MAVVHWLEDPNRSRQQGHEHKNVPRMSAKTMLKLMQLKNKLRGTRNSLYEEDRLARERGEI